LTILYPDLFVFEFEPERSLSVGYVESVEGRFVNGQLRPETVDQVIRVSDGVVDTVFSQDTSGVSVVDNVDFDVYPSVLDKIDGLVCDRVQFAKIVDAAHLLGTGEVEIVAVGGDGWVPYLDCINLGDADAEGKSEPVTKVGLVEPDVGFLWQLTAKPFDCVGLIGFEVGPVHSVGGSDFFAATE
jgi:hypothetical protein